VSGVIGTIPSSMVAGVACSAAAGKNPWLPLALIFLLAAPETIPTLMMDADLHRQLHSFAPASVLWTLGGVFAALALADSLADKIGVIEKWLVPISTAWRPFAGIAAATLIGVAAAQDAAADTAAEPVVQTADMSGYLVGGSVIVVTIALAALGSWIATMGKTGTRLMMTMVPVPGLKLAHSFVDDFFALSATVAGLAFGRSIPVAIAVALYLAVGIFTGPILTRLTWIHVRIGWNLILKWARKVDERSVPDRTPPKWLSRWLAENDAAGAVAFPAYVYRAPRVGRCRAGFIVFAHDRVLFATRIMFRPRVFSLGDAELARIGLSDTATARVITLVSRTETGALGEVNVYLFPAIEEEILAMLDRGAARARLIRVRPDSASARHGLPGFADRDRSVRFLAPTEAGSLRLQGLVTIACAIGIGIVTGGVFVPIGAGYLFSPFKRRFLLGLALSGYLSLCVVASAGLGWPAAVLYASLLNVIALRDLTRNALKARIDGYVDKRAWLPAVASRVWIPEPSLADARDRHREGDPAPLIDGKWRSVVHLLAGEPEESAPAELSLSR
jgi:hypothetical protein